MVLSVITPCYNEELVVEETYRRLKEVMAKTGMDYELVFINDGSRDNTYPLLLQLSESDKTVKILNFSRNFGHQCAVTAGINHCTGDLAVIIDADLQDPPEVILDMLEIYRREQANVVYGVRKSREGESWFKLTTAKWFYRILNKLSDVQFPVDTGDFRLIDRKIIDEFNRLHEKNKYIRGLISWMGYKQVPCYYERKERAAEVSDLVRRALRFGRTNLCACHPDTQNHTSRIVCAGLDFDDIHDYLLRRHPTAHHRGLGRIHRQPVRRGEGQARVHYQ